jgi:hypothetical protein
MIFKILISFSFIGCLSFAQVHQDLNPEIETMSKKDLSDPHLVFSDKYLEQMNQYFEYNLDAENKLNVNGKLASIYNIEMQKFEKEKVSVDFKDFKFENSKIVAYTMNNTKSDFIQILKPLKNEQSKIIYEAPEKFDHFCLFIKNTFAYVNVCRALNLDYNIEKMTAAAIEIKINQEKAEKVGVVLLQNLEKPISFSIQYGEFEKIEFSVIKRIPLLNYIYKEINSDRVHLELSDYGFKNSHWTDHVLLGQPYIELKLNPILDVRQEIAFSNQVIRSTALEVEHIPKVNSLITSKSSRQNHPHRRIGLGIQSSLYARSDQVFDVNLVSKNALSLQFSFEQVLSSDYLIDYALEYTQSKIADNADNVVVSGSDISFYSVKSSLRIPVSELIHLSIGGGLYKGNFYKTNANSDGLESTSSQLLMIPLGALFRFSPFAETEIRLPLEYSLIFGGDQIGSGALLSYGVEVHQNIQDLNCFFGIRSTMKSQKYVGLDQNEDHFQTYFGLLF